MVTDHQDCISPRDRSEEAFELIYAKEFNGLSVRNIADFTIYARGLIQLPSFVIPEPS